MSESALPAESAPSVQPGDAAGRLASTLGAVPWLLSFGVAAAGAVTGSLLAWIGAALVAGLSLSGSI